MSPKIAVAFIVAFVVYPFAAFGFSRWVNRFNNHKQSWRTGFSTGCLVGLLFVLYFWTFFSELKYAAQIGSISAILIIFSFATTFACLSSLFVRAKERHASQT